MENFKYLGVILNEDSNNQIDLQERKKMLTKHILYYKHFFFLNKNIPNKLQFRLKNTTIDKTLTYTSETGTLIKRGRKQMNIFERRVYRRILGPVHDYEKEN